MFTGALWCFYPKGFGAKAHTGYKCKWKPDHTGKKDMFFGLRLNNTFNLIIQFIHLQIEKKLMQYYITFLPKLSLIISINYWTTPYK